MPTPQKQPPTKRSQTPAPPGHRKPRQVQAPPQTKAAEHGSIHPTRRGNLYKKHLQEKKNKSMKITNKNKETHSHPHETTRRNNSESPPTKQPTPPTKQPTQKTPTSKTNQQGQPIKNQQWYTNHTTTHAKTPTTNKGRRRSPKKLLSKMNKTKTPNGAQPPYHTKNKKQKRSHQRVSNHPTAPTAYHRFPARFHHSAL